MANQIGPDYHKASDRTRDWSRLMQSYGSCKEHNTVPFFPAKKQK